MPQFTLETKLTLGETITIKGSDAHHILNVLRLTENDELFLSDGRGKTYLSKISATEKKSLTVKIIALQPTPPTTDVTLAVALIKHDRLEFVLQKAIELGCTKIQPFSSARTIPQYSAVKAQTKLQRWNKIARETAKQCGAAIKPEVFPLLTFSELTETAAAPQKVIFYEAEESKELSEVVSAKNDNILLVIGPEGGFTSEEITLARRQGFLTCGLGPLILRVETAALTGLTLTQYLLEHFSHPPMSSRQTK